MHRTVLIVVLALSVALLAAGPALAAPPAKPGEILVGFVSGTTQEQANNVEAGAGARELKLVGGRTHVLQVPRGQEGQKIEALVQDPRVRFAEPNYIVHTKYTPNDPSFAQLWGLKKVSAEAAWDKTTGSSGVVIGDVDTGLDYTHTDLAKNVWSNPGTVGGCAAGTHGYNAITTSCDPRDDNNHGTHTAGTIGAVGNNGVGVVGVNWITSIMGLKFLNARGSGTLADAITAIDFAVKAKVAGVNVRALNNSWGGGGFSQALLDEINKAGDNQILFVAAAGNDGWDNDVFPSYPCNYKPAAGNVICVAATDEADGLAYFSNYGATTVHLGAPGTNILSTVPGGAYASYNGTSMATPHVTGAVGLVLAQNPALTAAQVKAALLNNVDPVPSLARITVTGGRLNLAKALGAPAPPPPPAGDYTLSVSPASQQVVQGSSASYTVAINRTAFTGNVTLSVSELPAGASGSFNPNPTNGTSSILTVTTASTTPIGSYPLTITGRATGLADKTTSATLVVTAPPATAPPPCTDGECP